MAEDETIRTIPCELCRERLAVVVDRCPDAGTIMTLRLADDAVEHLRSHADEN
jgi:hypothetical protein